MIGKWPDKRRASPDAEDAECERDDGETEGQTDPADRGFALRERTPGSGSGQNVVTHH